MKIKRTERGWAGHFILGYKCKFRRNTLLSSPDGRHIVVSTVGNLEPFKSSGIIPGYGTSPEVMENLGIQRHYETMAFIAEKRGHYIDMKSGHDVSFESPWSLEYTDKNKDYIDNLANDMHERVVTEIVANFDRLYNKAVKSYTDTHDAID